jgi:hypothetical protein
MKGCDLWWACYSVDLSSLKGRLSCGPGRGPRTRPRGQEQPGGAEGGPGVPSSNSQSLSLTVTTESCQQPCELETRSRGPERNTSQTTTRGPWAKGPAQSGLDFQPLETTEIINECCLKSLKLWGFVMSDRKLIQAFKKKKRWHFKLMPPTKALSGKDLTQKFNSVTA